MTQSLWSLVEAGARARPDAPLIVEADGEVYTWVQVRATAAAWAASLRDLGPDARVATVLPNRAGAHMLRLACGCAGLTFAPISPLLQGRLLADALGRSSITDVIATAESAKVIEDAIRALPNAPRLHILDGGVLRIQGHRETADGVEVARESDRQMARTVVYTSGTSGPAKPVVLAAEALYRYGANLFDDAGRTYPEGTSYYSPWHPAHILGLVALEAAVHREMVLVLREKFDVASFWGDVRRHDSRLAVLISVAAEVWAARDLGDVHNPLELVGMSPVIPQLREFEERFGVQAVSIYGMTEVGPVLVQRSPAGAAIVGRPAPGYECRLDPVAELDAQGGNVGELVVRPAVQTSSYEDQGESGSTGWVDGWFHTGDLFIEVDEGYRFVGRIKDCIRRRGRNISVADLEAQVLEVPGVVAAACVGHAESSAPSAEEQIRLFVQLDDGSAMTAEELLRELRGVLPAYMVPHLVDIIDSLPRTMSGKLERARLRELPLLPTTYDRTRPRDVREGVS